MSVHTIRIPDWGGGAGGELRDLVWDDEAGTVDGDYSRVDSIRRFFGDPELWTEGGAEGVLQLEDPRHRPADFKGMIAAVYCAAPGRWARIVWPAALAGVAPTPLDPGATPEGADA